MTKSSWIKLAGLIAALGTAAGLLHYLGLSDPEKLVGYSDSLIKYVESFESLAPLVYVSLYVIGSVILLPGLLLSFVGAILFGTWFGTLYTWIGALGGSSLAFFIARKLGRESVDQLTRGKLGAVDRAIEKEGFTGLLLMRLIPAIPFNGLNFGAGFTSIRFVDYLAATAIGILPGTFMYQLAFARIGRPLLTGEKSAWEIFQDPSIVGVMVAFVAFAVALSVAGRWFKSRRPGLGATESVDDPFATAEITPVELETATDSPMPSPAE